MNGTLLTAALGLFLATGCAHTPGNRAALKEARPQTAIVTGSRIPQRVDVATGNPATSSSVRIYSRQQLLDTGRPGDTGTALRELDPSFTLAVQGIKR